MRADRLVAILLLLQARGQVTAAEVALEVEVSERTARRDLEALGIAGLPIYSQQGRNGGWRLAGGGRTDLSGLTAGEARALFLLAGPASAPATPQLKAALRKLMRALPEPLRSGAQAASAAVVVDPGGWDDRAHARPAPPLLDAVQQAVVDGEQITLSYVARNRESSSRIVHPLGLAAKGSTWYLVADTDAGLRTFRVDRMTSVERTDRPVVRPDGFELAQAWQLIKDEIEQRRTPVRARALASPHGVQLCRWILGSRVRIGPAGPDGRVEIELRGHHVESLAGEIAGLGAAIEIVEPLELRQRLARVGGELTATYGPGLTDSLAVTGAMSSQAPGRLNASRQMAADFWKTGHEVAGFTVEDRTMTNAVLDASDAGDPGDPTDHTDATNPGGPTDASAHGAATSGRAQVRSQQPAILTEGLIRSFDGMAAVDGLDLEVRRGEIYGFLGPNGAGKSTTVRVLCTLLAATGGRATVAGHDVAAEPGEVRLRIGVALQDAALDPKQTGQELLRLQGRLYGLSRREIDQRLTELKELVDIGDALHRPISTYSGGMRRRLDLAAALVHNPEVLFLDEPTTGLDPMSRVRVWEEVRRLNDELGMTVFLTTQYLEEADELADRVGILSAGRLVAEGTPTELKRSIGDDLIVVRVDGNPTAALACLAGVAGVEAVDAGTGEVVVTAENGAATIGPVAVALDNSGIAVRDLTLRTPTLDDVFLELTGSHIRAREEIGRDTEEANK